MEEERAEREVRRREEAASAGVGSGLRRADRASERDG